jgi:hypothetical protein
MCLAGKNKSEVKTHNPRVLNFMLGSLELLRKMYLNMIKFTLLRQGSPPPLNVFCRFRSSDHPQSYLVSLVGWD